MNIKTMATNLYPLDLEPYLLDCGYNQKQLVSGVEVVNGHRFKVPLTAFAHYPHDSRSACITVLKNESEVEFCRSLGSPLIFACHQEELLFFTQTTKGPKFEDKISFREIGKFFQQQKDSFAPQAVYRAKTLGRFDKSYQLSFVDLGLMPLIEEEAGRKLSELIERVVIMAKANLGWKEVSQEQGKWLLKSNFWLLAAKILKDKNVPAFTKLDLEDLETVYASVAEHYGSTMSVRLTTKEQQLALSKSAREVSTFGHCGLVSTEALAYLYERALITKETRVELGTHSTPNYLIDYIIGKLLPWIEEMPYDQRQVFEPACGHAAFLVGAMRLLGDLSPINTYSPEKRHQYFQERLHGNDIDSFALEIARLSLTLADAPNPNGWDLHVADVFKNSTLTSCLPKADIILANPPFENFKKAHKNSLSANLAETPKYVNKAAELLWQVVKEMKPGAIFGMVMPRGILHNKNAAPLRQYVVTEFEIKEILILPNRMFSISDAESTVILGRRLNTWKSHSSILYRRVRDAESKEFKQAYIVKQEKFVNSSRFFKAENFSFFVPDLEEIWDFCEHLPKFKEVANIGQGFQFCSMDNLPEGAITESETQQDGLVEGFARLQEPLQTYKLPKISWFNLDPSVIRRSLHGVTRGISQVLLNYARISIGPWRLKAFIDKKGHPVTSRFLVVRPNSSYWPLEALWGICNSPLANAYSYVFSTERDVLAGLMREMPIPTVDTAALTPLVIAVNNYFQAVKEFEDCQFSFVDQEELLLKVPIPQEELESKKLHLKNLHWRIDAEVLCLYNLPLLLERQLLDLFSGEQRRGVPFEQHRYFPEGYNEPLRLHELLMITDDWEKTNKRRTELIFKKVKKKEISAEELQELEALQYLTDCRIELLAPISTKKLEIIKEELQRKGMWREKV